MYPPYRFHLGQRIQHRKDSFSVVSFNILSQTCLEQHLLDRYAGVGDSECHIWGYRLRLIVNLLTRMMPSIICFQEVDLDPIIIRDLERQFGQHGYRMILQDPKKSSHLPIFVTAILYLDNEFDLLWHESRSRALLTELYWKKRTKSVFIGNLHLQANPDKADVRLNQARKALHRLEMHMSESGYDSQSCPIILCGDFNDNDDSNVVDLLSGNLPDQHKFEFEDIEHFMRQFCSTERDRETLPSYFSKSTSFELDFIFYTRSNLLPLAALHALNSEHDLQTIIRNPPPNQIWPSDHLPIGCVFTEHSRDVII